MKYEVTKIESSSIILKEDKVKEIVINYLIYKGVPFLKSNTMCEFIVVSTGADPLKLELSVQGHISNTETKQL